MKVLVCIPCLLTGGTEIQTLSLVQALVASGHSVDVACYFEFTDAMVRRYQNAGARVHLLSSAGVRPVGVKAVTKSLYSGLRRVVLEVRPDVAHVQYMAPGAIPILILRWLGIRKIVATAHTGGDIYSPNGLKLLHLLNNRFLSAFQCITERAEASFFGDSRLFDDSVRLKRRGNHFTIYNNLPSYIECRNQPRTAENTLTVGVVSRLEHIKGMDLVVPAFAEAVRQSGGDLRLLVVGDGTLRVEMETQARESGIADRVEFAGRRGQDELQRLYDRIDILLMPSRSEGFGLTAVEGMARGCVPVVADIGGLPEVVRDGRDGILHEPENTVAIAAAILGLVTDSQRMKQFSAAAVERARTFTLEAYTERIAAMYEALR